MEVALTDFVNKLSKRDKLQIQISFCDYNLL